MQNHNTMRTRLVALAFGWLRIFAFCVSLIFVAVMPASAEVEFSYYENTFVNYGSCLGIYHGPALMADEQVWLFSMDQSPVHSKVTHVIQGEVAQKRLNDLGFKKAHDDKPLWAEIGCAHYFRGDLPELLARVSPEPEDSSSIGFAIRNLPSGAWMTEGKGESVAMDIKDNPYVEPVRHLVTDACYALDSLVRVRRFPVRNGREIVQLDIGKAKRPSPEQRRQRIDEEMRQAESHYQKWAWPEQKIETLAELEKIDYIESVEICRFFLDDKRVLKTEKISRNTGEDERVDTPTDMNGDNWADTTGSAIGFISLNEGKDWDVLFVDVGFEGINYSIQRVDGSIIHYERSLYTFH